MIDRNLLVAYLSLKSERRMAEENKGLQRWLAFFAAISAGSATVSAVAVALQALKLV